MLLIRDFAEKIMCDEITGSMFENGYKYPINLQINIMENLMINNTTNILIYAPLIHII